MNSETALVRYFNMTLNNPAGEVNKYARLDQNLDRSIVNNAANYLLAVDSATVTLQNIPLFIMPMELNQAAAAGQISTIQVGVCQNMSSSDIANSNVTSVVKYLTSVIWIPRELGLKPVAQPATGTPAITPYYYCYSYEHLVDMINTAMNTSWTMAGSPGASPPVFSYDATTNLFAWTSPTAFLTDGGSATGWSVCWNLAYDNIWNNFDAIDNGGSRLDLYSNGVFILETVDSRLTNTVSSNLVLTQDYPTTDNFNSAQRLVITTQSIPTAFEYFPPVYGQGSITNTHRILVDIPLDFDNQVTFQRSTFSYDPNQYRWCDLQSTEPLRRISVNIQWVDKLNKFYDIPIKEADVCTVRLVLRHKSLAGI
jgi:hypothetical protein